MTQKLIFNVDRNGMYLGDAEADPSPLEHGVWLIPAGAIETPPPDTWPAGYWPQWNGKRWNVIVIPAAPAIDDALAKLQSFLQANPDVAALLNSNQGGV